MSCVIRHGNWTFHLIYGCMHSRFSLFVFQLIYRCMHIRSSLLVCISADLRMYAQQIFVLCMYFSWFTNACTADLRSLYFNWFTDIYTADLRPLYFLLHMNINRMLNDLRLIIYKYIYIFFIFMNCKSYFEYTKKQDQSNIQTRYRPKIIIRTWHTCRNVIHL